MTIRIFEVGGSIRDERLGIIDIHDRDFCAVSPDGWDGLLAWANEKMDKIFLVTPEFFTIRGMIGKDAIDIVMCRKDGPSTDGRRPNSVEPGTLEDDLARRDFTVNAMAWEVDHKLNRVGNLIDPHNGEGDLDKMLLRCVGDTDKRLKEDGLRLLRAARFIITKGFEPHWILDDALCCTSWWEFTVNTVSEERIREELHKMLKHNTAETLDFLVRDCSSSAIEWLFNNDGPIWLKPTMEKR